MGNTEISHNKRAKVLVEIAGRVGLVVFYGLLAKNLLGDMLENFRISTALLLFQELLVVVMVLCRRESITVSTRVSEWLVAIFGASIGLFMRVHGEADYLLANILSCVGATIVILGLSVLSRSFGLVPANRGVKTAGMYRIVRHPLYAGYNIIYLGFLINNFSLYNLTITLLWFAAQVMRIVYEERHLSQSQEYRDFKTRTRWRILPGVW